MGGPDALHFKHQPHVDKGLRAGAIGVSEFVTCGVLTPKEQADLFSALEKVKECSAHLGGVASGVSSSAQTCESDEAMEEWEGDVPWERDVMAETCEGDEAMEEWEDDVPSERKVIAVSSSAVMAARGVPNGFWCAPSINSVGTLEAIKECSAVPDAEAAVVDDSRALLDFKKTWATQERCSTRGTVSTMPPGADDQDTSTCDDFFAGDDIRANRFVRHSHRVIPASVCAWKCAQPPRTDF